MCSSERKFPELFKTHPTFVYSPLLVPSMACQTQRGVFFETPCINKTVVNLSTKRAIFCSDQGLTLDIDRGNLLRLGKDGIILAASHGTKKMSDIEIEKIYGRGRKKHIASEYAAHLHVSLLS